MIEMAGSARSVCAFVFARGGSKGVPGKNVRALAGKPLVAHSVVVALESSYVDRVVVSTDSSEIAAIAREYGAETPFLRPSKLATDNSPEWDSWTHALNTLDARGELPDIFLSVPATSPMRRAVDLDACIEKLASGRFDIVVTATESARNPCFNIIRIDAEGYSELAMKLETPITRRQDAPQFFDLTTVAYAARSDYILSSGGIFDGRVGCVLLPPERALDIDTELDFRFAEFLMHHRERDECQ